MMKDERRSLTVWQGKEEESQLVMTRKFLQGKFLDSLRLYVRGGTGGMGFPKYGGVGGKGGSVYVMAKEEGDLKSVSKKHSSKRVLAGHGGHSHKNRVLGCPGEDQYVEVPLGVTIIDEHGRVLGRFVKPEVIRDKSIDELKLMFPCIEKEQSDDDFEIGVKTRKTSKKLNLKTSNYLTDNKTCLFEASISAMQSTKDGLKHYNYQCHTVPFTKDFIKKGRGAHKLYLARLEEEKRIEAEWKKQKQEDKDKIKKQSDLDKTGSSILVAPGGPGGGPTNNFCGVKGQGHSVTLDLKLIADIGLVGFPNAGKSSLLKAISNAKPKVASYPFTTIRPNIGVLQYSDYRQITMADLPGLIEGAHANIGMGHKFLKHVERTKMLLLIVDIGGFQLSPRHTPRSCLETVLLLNKELELYKEDLLEKPAVLVINKMDLEGADEKLRAIQSHLKDLAGIDDTFDTVAIAVFNVIETHRA
uniref:GTP-binding protein 10 n=1 Tax=Timema monikensis TaxID=170555 RepID=A0A7R9EFJ2_9NEOP|nr:unnamed protein product [Timema monikensis]